MLKVIMITAILSAIGAIVSELLCTESKAKTFWLGTFALYFLVSTLAFYLLWEHFLSNAVPKQILIFILVAMISFVFAVLVVWVFFSVFEKWEAEEKKKLEGKEEQEGEEKEQKEKKE